MCRFSLCNFYKKFLCHFLKIYFYEVSEESPNFSPTLHKSHGASNNRKVSLLYSFDGYLENNHLEKPIPYRQMLSNLSGCTTKATV